MTSYIHGLSEQQAFSIAITFLTTDAHDWFIDARGAEKR
jgi:hypothetical protein